MGRDSNERGYSPQRTVTGKSINAQIADISRQLDLLTKGLKYDIAQNKKLKERAAVVLRDTMKKGAPIKEGTLKKSIRFLKFRRSYDAFVGPSYRGTNAAPHAHLVEYGYRMRNGEYHKGEGYGFIKNSYEQTKEIVLKKLIALAKIEFEFWGEKLQIKQ